MTETKLQRRPGSKYTEEQIVGILRGAEASGKAVREYCREEGIHETTFYAWKKRYGMPESSCKIASLFASTWSRMMEN